jgi:hypothetical protein
MSAVAIDVPFEGGTVPCLIEADNLAPFVVLRPVCEELGLDFETHEKRLQQQPWAVLATNDAHGSLTVIDHVTFAMWLATIQPGRMRKAAARSKIELYQRDAARAVQRCFFGGATVSQAIALPAAELIAELVERQAACERRLAEFQSGGRPARSEPVEGLADGQAFLFGETA